MNFDYLKETESLIASLKAEGQTSIAEELHWAMASSAVSSELLAKVKYVLKKSDKNSLSDITRKRADNLEIEVGKLLR